MRYLTFALAKGRLAKKTMAMLEEIGITCEEMKDEKTRKLIFVNEELKLKFFLSKVISPSFNPTSEMFTMLLPVNATFLPNFSARFKIC